MGVLKAIDVLAIFAMARYPLPIYCLVNICFFPAKQTIDSAY